MVRSIQMAPVWLLFSLLKSLVKSRSLQDALDYSRPLTASDLQTRVIIRYY